MSIADKVTRAKQDIDDVYEAGRLNTAINPSWTRWSYHFASNRLNEFVSKLKYGDTSNGIYFDYMFSSSEVPDGLSLDTRKGTAFTSMFSMAKMTEAPTIDTSGGARMDYMFYACRELKTIPVLNLSSATTITGIFYGCDALEELNVDGTINITGIDLQWSVKLNKAGILSIINALSASATAKSITLSLAAINKAFETSEGAGDGASSDEWADVMTSKLNWTISLI